MYYSEARKYVPWVLESLVKEGKISNDMAYMLAKDLDSCSDIFNEMVYGMSQRQGYPADSNTLKKAIFQALAQLYDKRRESGAFDRNRGWNEPSFDNFSKPKYDYGLWGNRKENAQSINDRAYHMFNDPSPNRNSNRREGSANGFDFSEYGYNLPSEPERKVSSESKIQLEDIIPVSSSPQNSGMKLKITNIENYNEMTTEEKLHMRIAGATRQKIDNKVFTLDRQVITLVREGMEDINLKYDHVNLYQSGICFDSCRDVVDTLQGQMSRDDIDKFYFRVVGFNILKQLDIDHDLFFREKERLDQILSPKNFQPSKDVYTNLDILLKCYEYFKNMNPDYVIVLEKFMIEELNEFLQGYMRLSSSPNRKISMSYIGDLEEFLRDSRFTSFRSMPHFELMMNQIIIHLINYLHGDGESMFINFDSQFQSTYTKTRKYMTISPVSNGLNSLDYYQYTDELKQILSQEIKKKVLVCIPSSAIITNFYSPGFVRKTLANMNAGVQMFPRDIDQTDYDNFMYAMVVKQIQESRTVPPSLIYTHKSEEAKIVSLGVTLDEYLIIE